MTINRLAFGQLTIISPTLLDRVKAELTQAATAKTKPDPSKAPTLTGLQALTRDEWMKPEAFVHQESGSTGIFPAIGPTNTAGVFPLPKGWGLIATNHWASVRDGLVKPDRIYPFDDLNHLLKMLGGPKEKGRPTEATVSDYLANERKLKGKPPIQQFEQN